jgi:hypothetical protein
MGMTPAGRRMPNGKDFWWDEEGHRNCWQDNRAAAGRAITSDPLKLPGCPGSATHLSINPSKLAALAPCGSWDPQDDVLQDPPGCDWFMTPRKPR